MSKSSSIKTQEPTLPLPSLTVLLHEYFNKRKNLHNFAKLKAHISMATKSQHARIIKNKNAGLENKSNCSGPN